MSGQGYHFAITSNQADSLLACLQEMEVLDITDQFVDAFLHGGEGHGGDKAWHVLNRCLSDGPIDTKVGSPPLNRPFLGGQLLVTEGSIVNLVTPERVHEAAAALARLDGAWFRVRFTDLFGSEYGGAIPEEDFQRFGGCFEELKDFYQEASSKGQTVVFVTDESLDDFQNPR